MQKIPGNAAASRGAESRAVSATQELVHVPGEQRAELDCPAGVTPVFSRCWPKRATSLGGVETRVSAPYAFARPSAPRTGEPMARRGLKASLALRPLVHPSDTSEEAGAAWHAALRAAWVKGRDAYRALYREYTGTAGYRRLRDALRTETGGRCQRCGLVGSAMHVHHLRYDTVGRERLHDVRYLCAPCHDVVTDGHDRSPIPPTPGQRASARAAHDALAERVVPPTPGKRRPMVRL